MLRVIIRQSLVVVEALELRKGCCGPVRSVREKRGGLRGIDIPRERVRGLEAEPIAPTPAYFQNSRVVPGIAVAALQLDRGKIRVSARRACGRKQQRAIG